MRLIIIVKGELPPREKMDQDLQTYLFLNTYLKYDDPFLMERLRYALPHSTNTIEPGSRKTQAINDHANRGKPDHHLALSSPLADREKLKMQVQLPLDIEMPVTPTSSTSSTVPFFPISP